MVINDSQHTVTQSAQFSQKQNGRTIYVFMKTMQLPGYH